MVFNYLLIVFDRWLRQTVGTALIESVILMPVVMSLMMGCFDLGQGININQKTISASQIIGDLVARNRTVNMTMMNDIITAGELALEPHNTVPWGYDIVSVVFDEDGDPVVLWRITQNMDPNEDAVASTKGLGAQGEGVVIVSSNYRYRPFFTNFLGVDQLNMNEVAFLRGRRSATVTCTNCPV